MNSMPSAEYWTQHATNRIIPIRIRFPPSDQESHVIIFSHGLGSTRFDAEVWGSAWSQAGFVVIHVQHPGSDDNALREGRKAWRSAANADQLIARARDISFVIDEIQSGRLAKVAPSARTEVVGLAGHSFGAHTVQALAGQRFAIPLPALADSRVSSFVAMSASLARTGSLSAGEQFGDIKKPFLCVTGTLDHDPLGNSAITPDVRRLVFEGLPQGQKALLVLDGADHMTFAGDLDTEQSQAGFRLRRQNVTLKREIVNHALVAKITTLWWKATLRNDPDADCALRQPQGLSEKDVWMRG